MKTYSFEEAKDLHIGKVGTPERDEYEREVAKAKQTFLMGEAIKEARLSKNLTQEQLGEMIGVKKAQVSRIERGCNLSLSTIARVFKAMEIDASFDVPGIAKVALW
ncbi:MAG: helix-turn-helix domain-containing protein [Prevotella sp.]|nr:helix-turn-helix domain-containing protein [Prevotella sp.]